MTPKEKAEAIKKQLVVINQLLKKPENKLCADCKKINPTWASVNLGVFVCINCSGCHREIGVHITKIRSVNLDVWPQEVLNNFKIINNKIANKYWECKLKNFDFKSLQGDKYKLIQFIRDKYENKKWIDTKKKIDPMSLIIKGKIKKYKKLFCESEDEDEEEQSDDDKKNKKRKNKKKKKDNDDSESEEDDDRQKKSKKKKRKDESEDNESEKKGKNKKKEDDEEEDDDEEDNDDDEDDEENDNKNKKNHSKNKKDEDDDDFEEVKEKKIIESKTPITQRPQQLSNNLFLDMNTNQNNQNNLNLNFNNNNSNSSNNLSMNNNNIVDIFNQQTPADKKSQDLMNNINNAYFSPQPVNSARTNNMFQQMPNNMGLNLQNRNNNLQTNNMNNYQNMGQNNIMNINHVHSTQNIHMNMNNNMFNMNMNNNMNNNMNYGMNNFAGMNNNMNSMNNGMQNNMNNNMNFNNNNNNLKSTSSSTIPSNIPSFNMEYFNQNLTGGKKSNAGSTYNFSKNKVDPFSNLVSFKK